MGLSSRPTDLPLWPVIACFLSFPVGWVSGFGFALPVFWATVMGALLLLHRGVRFPRPLLLWALFLVLVAASIVMIDTLPRAVGFAFRFGNYLSASVACLYVYNVTPERGPERRIAAALTFFWGWIVVGGYLGVVFPYGGLVTPAASVLPSVLVENDLVGFWVRPRFAEVQQPWGAPTPFARPSAPFPYTNGWGVNYALLLPFALSSARYARGWRRRLLIAAIIASAVPAVSTLNRGMFLALGVALAYTMVRLAMAGRVAPLLTTSLAGAVVVAVLGIAGVFDRVVARTSFSETNQTRGLIYREAFERTLEAPVFGWGAPRPSRLVDLSVGTQGHVWNVMFSHGFVALAVFVCVIWWLAWRTRNAVGDGAAAHVTVVMASVMIVYYGFDGPQLLVTLVAAALALRQVDGHDEHRGRPGAEARRLARAV